MTTGEIGCPLKAQAMLPASQTDHLPEERTISRKRSSKKWLSNCPLFIHSSENTCNVAS